MRVALGDAGRAVLEEPAETSVKELRFMEATRPRYTGVFSMLVRPVRDGQELRRKVLTGFFINGPLQAMSARRKHGYVLSLCIRWGDGRSGSPNRTDSDRRRITELRTWAQMRCGLLKTVKGRGRSGALDHLHGIVILSGTIRAAFIALMLQKLLSLGVGKAKEELNAIGSSNVVELGQDLLGDLTGLKSACSSQNGSGQGAGSNACRTLTEQSQLPCSRRSSRRG